MRVARKLWKTPHAIHSYYAYMIHTNGQIHRIVISVELCSRHHGYYNASTNIDNRILFRLHFEIEWAIK